MIDECKLAERFYHLLWNSVCDGLKDVAERLKSDEVAKSSDELILYMELDYPVKFGYCRPCDFKEVYLNYQTDTKVELPGTGYDSVVYECAKLNTCVPLLRTGYDNLVDVDGIRNEGFVILDNVSHAIVSLSDGWLGQWRDSYKNEAGQIFWVAKQLINTFVSDYGFDYLFYRMLNYYENYLSANPDKQTWYEEDFVEPLIEQARIVYPSFFLESDEKGTRIKRVLKRLVYSYDESEKKWVAEEIQNENVYHNSYFIKCADGEERWFFFDAFLEEAEKIKRSYNACNDTTLEYRPSYRILFDLDELRVFDMWQRFGHFINLNFLKKDWYDQYAYNDECVNGISSNKDREQYLTVKLLKYFRGRDHRVLSRKEAMLECIIDWSDNDDDCFVNDSDVELKQLQFVPSVVWGGVKSEKSLTWMDENALPIEDDVKEALKFQAELRKTIKNYK